MAKYGAGSAWLIKDGYDLTPHLIGFRDRVEAILAETTALDDTWAEHLPTGLRRGVLEMTLLAYDDVIDATLVDTQIGATGILTWGLAKRDAVGLAFTGAAGVIQEHYERIASRGDLTKAAAGWVVTGQVDVDGVLLHPLQAETSATGSTTAHDASASSANGAAGYLQVTAVSFTGGTNPSSTIKIQHSPDNTVFSDLVTFDNVTAIGAQRKTVTGTVQRYTRVTWATNGTPSAQSVTFLVGIKRL